MHGGGGGCMQERRPLKWAVRILLGCIRVLVSLLWPNTVVGKTWFSNPNLNYHLRNCDPILGGAQVDLPYEVWLLFALGINYAADT